jgi:HSP20 family protein
MKLKEVFHPPEVEKESRSHIAEVVDKLFDDNWRDEFSEEDYRLLMPFVNFVKEDGRHFTMEAEMPGFQKENITVEIKNNCLVIKGSRKEEDESKSKKKTSRRFSCVKFEKEFLIPEETDRDSVDAEFKNGRLTVKMAKAAEKNNENKLVSVH